MPTIEGVCNQALDLVGYSDHIGNIYEGSKASVIALNAWGHTRDMVLMTAQPPWAKRDIALTLLKSAPNITDYNADTSQAAWDPTQNPPLPWLYEYQYPADCLLPLQIKHQPFFLPSWRPAHKPFRPSFDPVTQNHVILTNQVDAILIYIAQILDPDDWYQDFTEIVIEALAKKFEVELGRPMPQRPQQPPQRENIEGASANAAG
jgi:hypothetical protein